MVDQNLNAPNHEQAVNKSFYKQVWFWVIALLTFFIIIMAGFYVYQNRQGITQTNYKKIKISSNKYGRGGTSLEQAKKLFGEPAEISSPDRIDYTKAKDKDEPVYYDVKWRDDKANTNNSDSTGDNTNDYGVEKGTIEIKFASKTGDKSDTGVISKDENI
ncbi:hypothetical protein JOC36_001681 [Weissella uvarum]|uniref:hypothetical protein n=1 Tax=Weissella uvarum TaxID=1479233 RepID=UPI00196055EC|nr:hypothetical protein [Weissella uvarum]MBM7618081.1 hypothetical protein [Weissella uvarum]MCM0595931.1 hypothetical protein [Weissella uvarum]